MKMNSRRTFLKLLAGLGAFVIPWTGLARFYGKKLEAILGKPSAKLLISADTTQVMKKPTDKILAKKAIEDIQALSDAVMQGRRAGTAGETRALVYLQEQLESLGLKAFGDDQYWQMFSIPSMEERVINGRALFRPDEADNLRIPAANILAGLPGTKQDETIIISAHYDHLGIYQGNLCPGANDNASGVGCVLETMRLLVKDSLQGIRPKSTIVAAFWGAEEMGYLGSKHFVKNPTIPLSEIKGVINYDTVGNGQKKDYILWAVGDGPLTASLKKTVQKHGAEVKQVPGQGHHSDETAFHGMGIDAITMLSRDWLEKNHTPADDFSIINEEKLDTASAILYDLVKEIAY
jgi:Zn-dependent M28 family amino/carboxypeptidase